MVILVITYKWEWYKYWEVGNPATKYYRVLVGTHYEINIWWSINIG